MFSKSLQTLGFYYILAFIYPSHTTNLFQVLDLSLFGLIKNENQYFDEDLSEITLNNAIQKLLKSYEKSADSFNIRAAFKKGGFIIDNKTNPRTVKFEHERVINNVGFKEIWNFNIKMNEIPKRQRDKHFGVINTMYLPPYSQVTLMNDSKKEKMDALDNILEKLDSNQNGESVA